MTKIQGAQFRICDSSDFDLGNTACKLSLNAGAPLSLRQFCDLQFFANKSVFPHRFCNLKRVSVFHYSGGSGLYCNISGNHLTFVLCFLQLTDEAMRSSIIVLLVILVIRSVCFDFLFHQTHRISAGF